MPPKGSDDAPGELSPKQELFVQEYIKDRNATRAYIRAGYAPRGAEANSSALMANHKVRAAIQAAIEEVTERNEITTDRIFQEMAAYAFRKSKNSYGAITEAHGSIRALRELGLMKGMYNDASVGAGSDRPSGESVGNRISSALERIRSG